MLQEKDYQQMPAWDLSDLYSSRDSKELQEDLAFIEKEANDIQKQYQGKINQLDGQGLAALLERYEISTDKFYRIASFAFLSYTTQMHQQEVATFYQNTQEKLNDISSKLIFMTLEINLLDEQKLQEMIAQSPELARYQPWLRDVRVHKDFQLSEKEELILHEKSMTGRRAWVRLFDETMADLKYPVEGKELSFSEAVDKLSSADPKVRESAGRAIAEVQQTNLKLFTLITNTLAKDKSISDNLRGYQRPITPRNKSNYIEDEVVDSLIATVKSNYKAISHRYYAWKAQQMGQEKLMWWDRNAPLSAEDSREYPWEEAVDMVLAAYEGFSPEIGEVARKFFDNNWIDVPPRKGKRFGAFAHPTTPSAHPYLMLNYMGKVRDVMTLAHELGHGVHQYLARKQGALIAPTSLTLSETASVFGEQLTFRSLLKQEPDPTKRKMLIAGKVEDMINTVVRQIAYCDFETQLHDARRKGELSPEQISAIWQQVSQESLGPSIDLSEGYQCTWSYIPHFLHSPFYVYAYAFGDCLVNSLYQCYASGKVSDFEAKYIELLSAGGAKWHKELLAPFGLDASQPDFWQQGLNMLIELIDELE
jgi:oligoendopeptidase F